MEPEESRVGRGASVLSRRERLRYGAVLKELRRQGFRGVAAIAYEHDSEKIVEEVAAPRAWSSSSVPRRH